MSGRFALGASDCRGRRAACDGNQSQKSNPAKAHGINGAETTLTHLFDAVDKLKQPLAIIFCNAQDYITIEVNSFTRTNALRCGNQIKNRHVGIVRGVSMS
jgi:hypothetical protein